MSAVELVADTNVVSYMFRRCVLGMAYAELIGGRHVGLTGNSLAELSAGTVIGGWGARRLNEQRSFLEKFSHVPDTKAMANICGFLRGHRARAGRPIDWPDAWAAACALWLDVPLVTHDRDFEEIAGLQVLTVHNAWRVGEEPASRLWSPQRSWMRTSDAPADLSMQ